MEDRLSGFGLGFVMAFVFTALLASIIGSAGVKDSYKQGQTDYAKGIIKYQCDTLKTGVVHCYELPNNHPN
jgi:hypothetical protein